MSAIAQKLCEEIVDPVVKSTSKIPSSQVHQSKLPSKKSSTANSRNRNIGKPTRSVVIKKEKTNKIVPNGSSKTVINKFRSKETILKKDYVEIGVNTEVSGSLRCDNNCITAVRKRGPNKCGGSGVTSCKCSLKRVRLKGTPKLIQTEQLHTCSLLDKACTQCVETASFGTTPFVKYDDNAPASSFKQSKTTFREPTLAFKESYHNMKEPRKYFYKPQHSFPGQHQSFNEYHSISKEPQRRKTDIHGSFVSYRSCKRWALSQYPVRGPDF
ncbi:uncharacterized protein LOC106131444 [Amyelois transitella]|uniref:uncharacterized protein LOC106131444 n=1 Tax=Amyelois transitella TaxID=680683 RepID=UPI00298F7934|nr:uncharacterized protein LOC106131444 [Amyelois transitella]